MDEWTPETKEELWITEDLMDDFRRVVDRLIEMQAAGAPILTPPNILSAMPDHFQHKKAPRETMPCRVGLRNFFIHTDGKVSGCHLYPSIGNIREQSAREIWHGPKAEEIRKQTISCERLCLVTCLSQKTLFDKAKMGMNLLKSQQRKPSQPPAPEKPATA